MPRFLHTRTGQFHWVEDPRKVTYAILSHTWRSEADGGEQSYAEILKLQNRHGIPARPYPREPTQVDPTLAHLPFLPTTSHPIFAEDSGLSAKIRGFCRIAREAGYELVWVDSGCIDKSSSAELGEAINSMFELYKHADVCYVYLVDVSDGTDAGSENSEFRKSRWHFRGWTLQELIAPNDVVFMDSQWRFFGTKYGLARTLECITRIDFDILAGVSSPVAVAKYCNEPYSSRDCFAI